MTAQTNWARTHTFSGTIAAPAGIDGLRELVASSDRIRAVGTRHSFNDIADGEAIVSLHAMPKEVDVNADARTVRVASHLPYAAIVGAIDAHGLALHNLGSLPHISVGGASATATHGSGLRNGNLSTAVVGLEVVTGDGGILRLDRDDPRFAGSVVHLGAIGVVTHLTLALQARYEIRQDVYLDVPWQEVLSDPAGVFAAAYSVSVFTRWGDDRTEQVWLKTRLDDGDIVPPDTWRAGTRRSAPIAIVGDETDNTTVQGAPGPWFERLPHFRFDAEPSAGGEEIQSEYFVALEDAASALSELRKLADRIDPLLLITELRTVAADDLWLSTAYGRTSLAIHFTWRHRPEEVRALLPAIEAALAPFSPRPHWGKWFADAHASERYPRFGDAVDLFRDIDPVGKFRNGYMQRVLG